MNHKTMMYCRECLVITSEEDPACDHDLEETGWVEWD